MFQLNDKPVPSFVLDRPEPVRVPVRVLVLIALFAIGFWLWVDAVLTAF